MSNNTSVLETHPVHLFFSPPKPKASNLKIREDQFVLDCTNPQRSKLPTYQHQDDLFNQPYLSNIMTMIKTCKENRFPRTSEKPVRYKKKRIVNGEEFKKYLSEKIQTVTQNNCRSQQSEPQSYLNAISNLDSNKKGLSSKHAAYIEHKFRCFKKRGKRAKNLQ